MSRLARAEIFSADEVAIVHVMNRTVRRCFLLGQDPISGNNYDHRKIWLENQLRRQAALFGIDLLGQAILSNHFHLVLRSRPDVVQCWDDTEVARRWLLLCPLRKDPAGQAPEPSEVELNTIRRDSARLSEIRSRLSDISWWMRLLSQQVAQRANREDQQEGKFWQARYRAVRILDEAALLACLAYVDLNPIRASLCRTLESSDHTSIQKRIRGLKSAVKQRGSGKSSSGKSSIVGEFPEDGYLSPLELDERGGQTGACVHSGGIRCSDKGILPIPVAGYISLLDWTARQHRRDQPGRTPAGLQPIFERLGIGGPVWCELTRNFGRLFYAVAGKPQAIDSCRTRDGQRRYKAKRAVRELIAA